MGYSPSAEAIREPEGLSDRQKKFLDYWRHLDTRLEERGIPADLIVPRPSNTLPVSIGKTGSVEIQLGVNQQRKQVSVSLNLYGEIGDSIEKHLLNEKEQIEKDLGYHLEWESGDIYISDEGIGIWDQEDWPIQHDWMGDRLEDFLNVFRPEALKLEEDALTNPDVRRKIEKRERLIEYWNACATELIDSSLRFRENEPSFGRVYCRFEAIDTGVRLGCQYYSDGPGICVYFAVSKKAGRRVRSSFKDIVENSKTELEKLLGEEIEWSDPYISIYTEGSIESKAD
jgi:hypothetical protein